MELKYIVLIVLAVLTIAAVGVPRLAKVEVEVESARELVSTGATLLDVRSPGEFRSSHLDGALNIPVGELGARLTGLGDNGRPVVVYCRSGARSARAKSLLESAGFAKVVDIGAMRNW